MRARYTIWDLDNCLSDDKWREPHIDWHLTGNERYRRYNSFMQSDPVGHLTEFRLMEKISTPVFFTGRSEEFSGLTNGWILQNLSIAFPLIYYRGQQETLSPADLKQKMLRLFLQRVHATQIIAAFDDLPSIVDMYRKHGIPAAVLAINPQSGAYAPSDLVPATTTI